MNSIMDNNVTLESQVEVITPEIAREYLKRNTLNRPLHKDTVKFYASTMLKNQWQLNGEPIIFSDKDILLNGQHRLEAVVQSGKTIPFLVVRGCKEESFITFDSGRTRKIQDVFYLSDVPNYQNIASIISRYFMFKEGWIVIGHIHSLKRYRSMTKKDLLDEYFSDADTYQKAYNFSNNCYRKLRIMSMSEIGGMYLFLLKEKKHPVEVIESFFRMLFFNENVKNNTINLLRDRLVNSKIQKQEINSRYKEMLIFKTWNCYIKGEELKVLKWNESAEGWLKLV